MDRTVLVVDDESEIRDALIRVLRTDGYDVLQAPGGTEALQMLQDNPVQLLISDNSMPGMSGIELLKVVRVRHPSVMRIMLTGDRDPEVPVRSINESEVYRFIRKPWNNSDLRTIVHFAFRVGELEEEKRQLLALARKEREVRKRMETDEDPADLEAELLLLAETEAKLLDG